MDERWRGLERAHNRPSNQRGGRTGGGRGGQHRQSEQLPPECIINESFYKVDSYDNTKRVLKDEIFCVQPKLIAEFFYRAQYKRTALRQLFNSYNIFASKLKDGRITFDKAKEEFRKFFTERVEYNHNRKKDNKPLLPDIVFDFINSHKELALQDKNELLGLLQYLKNIYCFFKGN